MRGPRTVRLDTTLGAAHCGGGGIQYRSKTGIPWTRPQQAGGTPTKCLDVHTNNQGTRVWLWSCNGTGAQLWQLVPGGGGVSLVNPQSGLCLADPGNATADGTGLQIATCASDAGQAWRAQ